MEIITAPAFDIRPSDQLRVALAQIAPVWLDRRATLAKVEKAIEDAADQGAALVTFGEALVPGYPFWVELSGGAKFNDAQQKEFYAHYLDQGVMISRGDLDGVCTLACKHEIAVYLGIMERAEDRGGHTLYASLVYIDPQGIIQSVHRKLQPTYEERLVWGMGDGHGLRAHDLGPFKLGGLNCWENWLPLARTALYGQGTNLHVSVWPGNIRNTKDISRFIAFESRSYVIAVSSLMRPQDIPADCPIAEAMEAACLPEFLADGGSVIATPDGNWLMDPVTNKEVLIIADLDHAFVRRERHALDIVGHYSRPDVTRLNVNRKRLGLVAFED